MREERRGRGRGEVEGRRGGGKERKGDKPDDLQTAATFEKGGATTIICVLVTASNRPNCSL